MSKRQKRVKKAVDEHEELYQRITSSQSRKAADMLFAAKSSDLQKTYEPRKLGTGHFATGVLGRLSIE